MDKEMQSFLFIFIGQQYLKIIMSFCLKALSLQL